jgi:hypothetical protein
MRLVCLLLVTVFLYIIPLVFITWILPGEFDTLIFTTVDPGELPVFSSWFTTNLEFKGINHTLVPFRTCYMLCLAFSSALVSIAIEVLNLK